jgi:hypothetical protein
MSFLSAMPLLLPNVASLVQLGSNLYPVFRTGWHVKTTLSPAPVWRGNCGTQY